MPLAQPVVHCLTPAVEDTDSNCAVMYARVVLNVPCVPDTERAPIWSKFKLNEGVPELRRSSHWTALGWHRLVVTEARTQSHLQGVA